MTTHLAAVLRKKGQPFEVESRPTPKPGPEELLIAVKSVAINPADARMRNLGLFIPTYPTVIGFDVSGLVLETGSNVPSEGVGPCFHAGKTRVAAYSASVFKSCDSDYGVFQERCLVPWQHAVPLPDSGISWNEAATLPVAAQVPLSAWDVMGIPRIGEAATSGQSDKKEALLIWGASSSVGTMGVQSARMLRDDPNTSFVAVYATAGAANKSYIAELGADKVFDYKDPEVVDAIVSAAQDDGLTVRHCFLANGELSQCQGVLKALLKAGTTAKIASAPVVPQDAHVVEGLEIIFVMPSMADEKERLGQFRYWLGTWLRENLANGSVKPSPEPTVIGKGLEAINAGLDRSLQGVSCTKLVVEVAE